MRVRVVLPAFVAIASLIVVGGVASPAAAAIPAPAAVTEEVEVSSEAWTPPENAADGGAPAPNPPSEEWEPAAETRFVEDVALPEVPADPTAPGPDSDEPDASAAPEDETSATPEPPAEQRTTPDSTLLEVPVETTAPVEETTAPEDPAEGEANATESATPTPPAEEDDTAETPAPETPSEDGAPPADSEAVAPGAPEQGMVTPMAAPAGTVAGAPGVGELPWFTFQDFELWEKSVVRVNVANGNLLVKGNESSIAVPGFGLRQDSFYNGLSTLAGSLGGGWQTNNGAKDIGVVDGGSWVDYYAVNGVKFRFTPSGTTYTAPNGSNLSLKKDTASTVARWVVTSNKTGEEWRFSTSGWLTSTVDRNGIGETYSYDTSNRISAVTNTNGRGYTFAYATNKVTVTDTAGRSTVYTMQSSRLTSVTQSSGEITTFTYDSTGRLSTVTYPSVSGSPVTSFQYDSSHRVTSVTQQFGTSSQTASTTFVYNAGQTVVTDPNGNAAKYTIDGSGRVTETLDALNRKRSQTWTANSDIATSTDAMAQGNLSTYTYDGNINQTRSQLPTGAAATAAYAIGANCSAPNTGTIFQPKCSTDAAGNTKQYLYDASGNLVKQTNVTSGANQTEFETTYENSARSICGGFKGQVCSTKDGNGKTTTYSYNVNGDMTVVTPPSPLGATTYAYDALGRVTSTVDGNVQTVGYQYDVDDRVVLIDYPVTNDVEITYFDNGLTEEKTEVNGTNSRTESYTYDKLGRLTSSQLTLSTTSNQVHSYTYDKVGNLLTFSQQTGNWSAPITTITYTYDAANQLSSIREPGGTCPTAGSPAPNSGCTLLQYDNNANEIKRTYPGGAVVDTTRDGSGRSTRITSKSGSGATVVDIGYSFALPGTGIDQSNVQTRTSYLEEGIPAGAVTTYSYDLRNRLTKAEEKIGATVNASWSYAYDGASNRTQQIRSGATGATAGTISYTYNDANQITSATGQSTTWTYDGAGQQTRRGLGGQQIDYNDRLAAVKIGSKTQAYLFEGNSNRVSTGTTTSYANGALGLASITDAGQTISFTRTPDGSAVGYRNSNYGSPTVFYYVTDHLGSVAGIFKADGSYGAGYTYSPYGETRTVGFGSATSNNPLRYIGGELDSSGLYKLGARYYDPTLGRFTQPDPSGQENNPYSYAGCNPVNGVDPSGLAVSLAQFACVVGVVSLLIELFGIYQTIKATAAAIAVAPVTGSVGFWWAAAGGVATAAQIALLITNAYFTYRTCRSAFS